MPNGLQHSAACAHAGMAWPDAPEASRRQLPANWQLMRHQAGGAGTSSSPAAAAAAAAAASTILAPELPQPEVCPEHGPHVGRVLQLVEHRQQLQQLLRTRKNDDQEVVGSAAPIAASADRTVMARCGSHGHPKPVPACLAVQLRYSQPVLLLEQPMLTLTPFRTPLSLVQPFYLPRALPHCNNAKPLCLAPLPVRPTWSSMLSMNVLMGTALAGWNTYECGELSTAEWQRVPGGSDSER